MKNYKLRKLKLVLLMTVVIFLFNSITANAITVGITSQSDYKDKGCELDNRYSIEVFADRVSTEMKRYNHTVKYNYKNTHSWEVDMKAGNRNNDSIDDVNLAIFSGHGYAKGTKGLAHNSLHFYTLNSYTKFHNNENDNEANLGTHEAVWGTYNASTRWVLTYTCNFLNTTDSYYNFMMQGINMCMGFSTKMYIDSSQGSYLGSQWGKGADILRAFMYSCSLYQSGRIDGGCIASVIYAEDAEHDTIYKYGYASSKPKAIFSSDINYYMIQKEIK